MRFTTIVAALFLSLGSLRVPAQELQVSASNPTIYVSAEESVKVDAELAQVHFGYQNFAPTEDQTFADNASAADRITRALLKIGIKDSEIETDSLVVTRSYFSDKTPEAVQQQRRFTARQMWRVSVKAVQAQEIVNTVLNAGGNIVNPVYWTVRDRNALQSRAMAAAIAKAQATATQMSAALGAKLGKLIYASNFSGITSKDGYGGVAGGVAGGIPGEEFPTKPRIRLFPQKVEESATVYAVYATQ